MGVFELLWLEKGDVIESQTCPINSFETFKQDVKLKITKIDLIFFIYRKIISLTFIIEIYRRKWVFLTRIKAKLLSFIF